MKMVGLLINSLDAQQYIELDNGEGTNAGTTALDNVLGADTITATASTTITAYSDKEQYLFTAAQTNTGAATLNIDSIGAKSVLKNHDEAIVAGDFEANQVVIVVYNVTDDVFEWTNQGIMDNSITLAKMAGGTDGNLITYDASGDPAFVATGNALQVLTSNGVGAAPTMQTPIFSKSFTSSAQTITAAALLTLAHSLSAAPTLIQIALKNVTTEYGWVTDDEVIVGFGGESAASRGAAVYSDATNVYLRIGSAANSFSILNKTAGTIINITNANWKIVVKAWT